MWYRFPSHCIIQSSPTDLRNFDPTLTCIPPTLSDLITTDRSLHVDNFDYVAPDDPNTANRYKVDMPLKNEAVHTTTVEVVGRPSVGSNPLKQKNSTDEEKAKIRSKGGTSLAVPGLEGQFVEGRLERSNTPYASKVVVTAEINP